MNSFQSSTWADIETLREQLRKSSAASVEEAAQAFASNLAAASPTVVLARLFLVVPYGKLPARDRAFATALVGNDAALGDLTPVLSLLGTAGRRPEWCDRTRSKGHLAIPLLGAAFVRGIPMLAKLMADLDVDLASLDDGKALDTRRLLGGRNAAFFVADARSAQDGEGRKIIPSHEFVVAHGVQTVFGMGGAYFDGTLTVAVVFTAETIDRLVVDRFPSLISNFKMATAPLVTMRALHREPLGAA